MDIVEFQGGKYHLLADDMGGFKLNPVGCVANSLEHHQPFGNPKVEEEWEVVAETEPNWSEAPADATHYLPQLKLFFKRHQSNKHWLAFKNYWSAYCGPNADADLIKRPEQTGATMQKPTDATHYCPINDAFVKITGRTCHYYRDGQWVIENPARFSALVSLTKLAEKPTPSQKLMAEMLPLDQGATSFTCPEMSEACKKVLEQTGAKVQTNPTASQINESAMKHIRDRASTYDQPQGERSMGKTVIAFNAITGRDLTESEGWLLLQVLKDVRQWQNPNEYHQDSGEDCIAYAALKAESLAGGR